MSDETAHPPPEIQRAALLTLHRALVFCRNYSYNRKANMAVVYNLMDALHPVPEVLANWGSSGDDIDRLKLYLRCFDHQKWKGEPSPQPPPNLILIFEDELRRCGKSEQSDA